MRNKILIFIVILMAFTATIPNVISNPTINNISNKDKNQDLPDLVGSVEIVEIDNYHYFRYSITNIGDAPAETFEIYTVAYPFGVFPLRGAIFEFLRDMLPQEIFYFFWAPLVILLKIHPFFLVGERYIAPFPLNPGETYTSICGGPFDDELEEFFNEQICYIIECIVDPNNDIKESNEFNNREVLRWWFPLKTDPPKN
jgi:hypothetical protein